MRAFLRLTNGIKSGKGSGTPNICPIIDNIRVPVAEKVCKCLVTVGNWRGEKVVTHPLAQIRPYTIIRWNTVTSNNT